MHTAAERPARLPSLTGLRFVASGMVLFCHLGITLVPRVAPTNHLLWSYVYKAGVIGVTFFFILSGFVLTWVAKPGDSKRGFWRRRAAKVFPNHLATLAVAIPLMIGAGAAVELTNIVPTLFLVQGWIPDQEIIIIGNPNGPTWSLACEVLFYLSFPFLLPLLKRIRPDRLGWWAAAVVAVMAAVPFIAKLLPYEPLMAPTTDSWLQTWFVYYFPVTRALEFILGILVALMVMNKRWRGPRLGLAGVLALGGYAASAHLADAYSGFAIAAVPIALLIAAAATADAGGRRTPFGGRTMVWLGEVSYAVYMVHWMVVLYGPINAVDPASWTSRATLPEALLDALVTLAVVIVLAWLLYTFVEKPAMRWSRPKTPLHVPQLRDVVSARDKNRTKA